MDNFQCGVPIDFVVDNLQVIFIFVNLDVGLEFENSKPLVKWNFLSWICVLHAYQDGQDLKIEVFIVQ